VIAAPRWPRAGRAWAWIARELRPHLSIVYALVAYSVLRVVFVHVVGTGGFATPGSLDKGLAAFALVILVMRITVLVGVPLVVTYRIVQRLFRIGRGDPGGARTDDAVPAPPAGSTQSQ
jgi:hypothetical protein